MENSITQMLVKKSLFVTNKVFREQLANKPQYRLKHARENFAF